VVEAETSPTRRLATAAGPSGNGFVKAGRSQTRSRAVPARR